MTKSLEVSSSLPLRQWLALSVGVLLVTVPWWLGMLWLVGLLS